jgi:hypothetical protein
LFDRWSSGDDASSGAPRHRGDQGAKLRVDGRRVRKHRGDIRVEDDGHGATLQASRVGIPLGLAVIKLVLRPQLA